MTRTGRILGSLVIVGGLAAGTVRASSISGREAGVGEPPDDAVSLRHESIAGRGFFGSWTGRSHWGGGLHGGK
jgi:hypothetical protein